MIPKVINYCWFGGTALPDLALKCIQSWKKYMPDYEIKEWNESNFDVNMISYTKEAYEAKKYAFVSDFARFWILYHYGGVYFDTDVEVIRNMDSIIDCGAFLGCEKPMRGNAPKVAPGLGAAAEKGHPFYKRMLDFYSTLHFLTPDGALNTTTIVEYTTEMLRESGSCDFSVISQCEGITIYPFDYFCPKDYLSGKIVLTENSHTIHHYSASWKSKSQHIFTCVERVFGYGFAHFLGKVFRLLHLYS